MGLFFVGIAAMLASLANFFIRKNLDNHGSAKGHLLASFGCSLLVSLILNLDILKVPFSVSTFFTGIITGTLIAAMMGLTALTLSKGPSGLTFAFQTSGSVFPAIIYMVILFKENQAFSGRLIRASLRQVSISSSMSVSKLLSIAVLFTVVVVRIAHI